MHDIAIIRHNAERFDLEMQRRGIDACSEAILALDEKKRSIVTKLQEKQGERNKVSKDIGLKKRALTKTLKNFGLKKLVLLHGIKNGRRF